MPSARKLDARLSLYRWCPRIFGPAQTHLKSEIRNPFFIPAFKMDERRILRVSEAVREELIELIGFEMADPRLLAVEVSVVNVSPDGRHAHVLVGLRGDDKSQKEALAGLDHAKHYLRHELARRLSLRRVPELHFEADAGAEVETRIERLLRRARKTRGEDEKLPSK